MNATEARPGVADYLGRVRAALADLPADELTEVMEDVEPHVTEVFAEAGDADEVTRRLGTPEAYAAELRAAGGYPPPIPVRGGTKWAARYTLWVTLFVTVVAFGTGAVALAGRNGQFAALGVCVIFAVPALVWLFTGRVRPADVEALAEYRFGQRKARAVFARLPDRVVDYLRSLKPAWWLVRIGLVVVAVFASRGEAAVVLLGVVVLVTWAQPRSREDRRLVPVVVAANACLAGVVLALLAFAIDSGSQESRDYYPVYSTGGLTYDGSSLRNVYAVDGDGKAITEFYLYDEDGSPIKLFGRFCDENGYESEGYVNRFPLPRGVQQGPRHTCDPESGMPFVPLPPKATDTKPTDTKPTTAPTPSTTAVPTSAAVPPTAATSTPPTTPAPTTTK
ncbi:DUF1700 domain-containing protein [Actinokineospora terrae]|uniref:Uncharacterized membrane protein n=1 Tax=Actinokineospora terrae TaxID=155974 RepID=A0A1H9QCS0_9PSEU|nr:hypothetical protein [Actinokineospora terrae]SER58227.1 Uncharacterized membrane protein [Actinokineospora terrae]